MGRHGMRRAMDTVGIGMIGSGFMGLTYSEVIARHSRGARLVAVAGARRYPGVRARHSRGARLVAVAVGRRAGKLGEDYGVPAEPTVEALLARRDIDAVILATPDQYRTELTLAAAAAGKHVLAEK